VLFEKRLREGIHEGRITLAFRRWRRGQVVAGHRYRTGLDLVEAEAVDIVATGNIDSGQARAAGYATVGDLLASLRGDAGLPLYRIRFRRLVEPDPRAELAAATSLTSDEVAALAARLARMDRAGARGPWTAAVLAQVSGRPGVSSAVLAEEMGWVRADLKLQVRRLKELGLTISLDVGYRLSPRGEAYLAAQQAADSRPGG
jgi:biotin operon repressor